MADQQHVDLLRQGAVWNQWREEHPEIQPDLSEALFHWAGLGGLDLRGANLRGASLWHAFLPRTDLRGANLRGANLVEADLRGADLRGADLRGANLEWVNLSEANLSEANLMGCFIYAISAWDVTLTGAFQSNLIITRSNRSDGPAITVDDLEVAQFIHLILNNKKIRKVIDVITSKVVLILGRFTPDRKAILDALRDELHRQNYAPVLFDFEKPASRDLTETVSILAHLARFIIVDLSDPSSAPHEVATVIPHTVVPVQPLLSREPLIVDGKVRERREYAMFEDLRRRYHWVLPTFRYQDIAELLGSLQAHIIAPAEQKARELTQPR
jgi:Pentapeptide repeats (8 copies)